MIRDMRTLESATDQWWAGLSAREQRAYLRAHPTSKYARDIRKPAARVVEVRRGRREPPKPRGIVPGDVADALDKTHRALMLGGLRLLAARDGPRTNTISYAGPGSFLDTHDGLERLGYVKRTGGHPVLNRPQRYHEYEHPDGHQVTVKKADTGIATVEARIRNIPKTPHG